MSVTPAQLADFKRRAAVLGLAEASLVSWLQQHTVEIVNLLLSLMEELFSFKAEPGLNFDATRASVMNRKALELGDCVDCFCCILKVIDEASLVLSTVCCQCCSDDGCTPAERKAACVKAGDLLVKARLLLAKCC